MEVENVATSYATKGVIWLKTFLGEVAVIPGLLKNINSKLWKLKWSGKLLRLEESQGQLAHRGKYNLISNITNQGDVEGMKIARGNMANPFTKSLPAKSFLKHAADIGYENLPH